MHLPSLPTMEHISVPVRRHSFVVQVSVRLIDISRYNLRYYTLKQGISLSKAITALLRESHTLNKAVTALFTSKAAALNKAVIVLWHTTALLRDPHCIYICICTGGKIFGKMLEGHRSHTRADERQTRGVTNDKLAISTTRIRPVTLTPNAITNNFHLHSRHL